MRKNGKNTFSIRYDLSNGDSMVSFMNKPEYKIGVGVGNNDEAILRSINHFDFIVKYYNPEEMINDLSSGKINAAIRGSMSSADVIPALKNNFSVESIERMAIMEHQGKRFALAPVGIDEGWNISQKVGLVERGIPLLKKLGMGSKVAIMSGGRKDDYGRCEEIDRSLSQARQLSELLKKNGINAYDAEILIENIVKEADMIIAPDGISGNLLFRSMHYVGGVIALGAPVLNIDKIFIDTSRGKINYRDSIELAIELIEAKE